MDYASDRNFQIALARYLPENGDLDPDFKNGGKVETFVTERGVDVDAVVIDSWHRIVVAGSAKISDKESRALLVRYLPDGSLDVDA